MIRVYHLNDKRSDMAFDMRYDREALAKQAAQAFTLGSYTKVAEVDTESLEIAWQLTNNIESSWSLDPHASVTVSAPLPISGGGWKMGYRSSSVGDVFLKDGVGYVVAPIGFVEAFR